MEVKEKTNENNIDINNANPNIYSIINSSEKFDQKTFEGAAYNLHGLEQILEDAGKGQVNGDMLENAGSILMEDPEFFYNYSQPEHAMTKVLKPTVKDSSEAFTRYVMNNAEPVLGILKPKSQLGLLQLLDLKSSEGDEEWNKFTSILQDSGTAHRAYQSKNPQDKIKYLSGKLIGGQSWAQRLLNVPGINMDILDRLVRDYLNISSTRLDKFTTNEDGTLKTPMIQKYSIKALEIARKSEDKQYFGALAEVSKYLKK